MLPTYRDRAAQEKNKEKSDITLKYLYLQQNEISDSQVFSDFKYGLNKSHLVELNLMNNKLGDMSIRFIAQAIGGVCQIRKLNLTNTKMTYKGAHNILNGTLKASRLVELTLDQNILDGSKLKAIRETLINNKKLETLNMNECQLGEEGAL